MKNMLKKIRNIFKGGTWLALMIVCAALLMEIFSAAQYYYTKKLLESELEKKASMEITMKDDIEEDISDSKSINSTLRSIIQANQHINGVGLAFVPGYYHNKDELCEPWAFNTSSGVEVKQIAQRGGHDYTNLDFYKVPITTGEPYWSDPYIENVETKSFITTYSVPIKDDDDRIAGVAGIDLSIKWLSDTINNRHIYPSSYCLLLTDDGDLAHRMLSPKHHVAKYYLARLRDPFRQEYIRKFRDGILLRGAGLHVPVGSTVGAGDAMMAAFCYGDERNLSFEETCRLALAVSAAAVMQSGTQPPQRAEIDALLPKVTLERI